MKTLKEIVAVPLVFGLCIIISWIFSEEGPLGPWPTLVAVLAFIYFAGFLAGKKSGQEETKAGFEESLANDPDFQTNWRKIRAILAACGYGRTPRK